MNYKAAIILQTLLLSQHGD